MELGKEDLQRLANRKVKFEMKASDADLIYAATNPDSKFCLEYFGRERYEDLLTRIQAAIKSEVVAGVDIDMLSITTYSIIIESLLNEDFKEKLIKETNEETYLAALKQVRDALEPFMGNK